MLKIKADIAGVMCKDIGSGGMTLRSGQRVRVENVCVHSTKTFCDLRLGKSLVSVPVSSVLVGAVSDD